MFRFLTCALFSVFLAGTSTLSIAETATEDTRAETEDALDLWIRVRDDLVKDRIRLGEALNDGDLIPVITETGVRTFTRKKFVDRIRVASALASVTMLQSNDPREQIAQDLARVYEVPPEAIFVFAAERGAPESLLNALADVGSTTLFIDHYLRTNKADFRRELSDISDAIDTLNDEIRGFEAALAEMDAESSVDLADQWRGHGTWPVPEDTDRFKYTEVLLLGPAPTSVCLEYRRDYIGKHTEPNWSRRIHKLEGHHVCIACPVGWKLWNSYDADPTCTDRAR